MKTLRKHISLLLILLGGAFSLYATDAEYAIYSIGREGTESQFEDTRVNRIYKDSDGFIWIGTGSTVERIDGKHSLVYSFAERQQSNTPSLYLINALLEYHKHDFWVGSIQGLWRMNHSSHTLERMFPEKINIPVQALAKDENGRLYIGTVNGLYIYDGKQLRHIIIDEKNILSDSNRILDIALYDSDTVWLLTSNSLFLCDVKSGSLKRYACNLPSCGQLTCLLKVKDTLYIGTEKEGIATFDLHQRRFAPYWNGVRTPVSGMDYKKGVLGIATQGQGIYLLSIPEKQVLYSASYSIETEQNLLSNMVSSILFVKDDVWCGTNYYQGLNILREKNKVFRRYDKGILKSKRISARSFLQTPDYTFIGTNEGFYYRHEATGRIEFVDAGNDASKMLRSNLIFSFHKYEEDILIGTCGGGIAVFNPQSGTFKEHPLTRICVSNDIFMFLEDKQGTLWLATTEGLYSYNPKTQSVKEYNATNSGMPGNIVYGIFIDSSQRFWVGTDKGIAIFDSATGQCSQTMIPEEFRQEAIRYICEGRDGTLFFAQLDYRLLSADKSLSHFHYPLPTHCQNIVQDDQGYYWLGKWDGLLRVNENMDHYIFVPALNELSASAGPPITKDEEGNLWVCGTQGLFVVNPQAELTSSPVRITEIQVNGKSYADSYTLHPDSTLRLKSGENNVTFHFASLGYEVPKPIKYEYRLEGKDSTWIELTNENRVSYFNLPAGDYVFQVRKLLDLESVDKVSFSIGASRSWLAYSAVAGIILLALAGLALRRRRTPVAVDAVSAEEQHPPLPTEMPHAEHAAESYVKLSDEEAHRIIEALQKYMQEEEPYLNVDLKQSEVAVAIGYPTYLLSAIFTHYLKTGYYDFVNNYRVERFKQSISEGLHKKYTLVTLAEKCGFKSKASFFRAFKKFTGSTPSEYIQQHDSE